MSEWIKTSDCLPDGKLAEYNVMIKGEFTATTLTYDPERKAFIDNCGNTYRVSHWQKLPEPPKDGVRYCCFCGAEIEGYGNNAEPIHEDVCCDVCNLKIVVPVRLAIAERMSETV